MTEAEWLAATDPEPMLRFAAGRASRRKLLLFGSTCGRRVWGAIALDLKQAVKAAEQVADGRAGPDTLRDAVARVIGLDAAGVFWPEGGLPDALTLVTQGAVLFANTRLGAGHRTDLRDRERSAQAGVLRDVLGNPFRPAALDRSWLTSTVAALARGVYRERAFERLPILADALQDAGCEDDQVLTHCRDEAAPHVRGCWVVDLLLGKG